MTTCPVCLSIDGFPCIEGGSWAVGNVRHECEVCGVFGTTREVREDYLGAERNKTTKAVRAAVSHWSRLWQAVRNEDNIPIVTSDLVEAAISGTLPRPNPAEQATNIIRFVGDETKNSGESLKRLPPKFHVIAGSISREFAILIVLELVEQRLLTAVNSSTLGAKDVMEVRLTLNGWKQYEFEIKGKISGSHGFIALKFGDEVLDPFLKDHIKPAIQSIGMELRDMRDTSQAGIIDNLMRMAIRDSAFVLVDLTHDNSGAYWEAGFAEGLGKPVLYICEKSKFDCAKTHFDTNHCTTVLWDTANPDEFKASLLATLKRSQIG